MDATVDIIVASLPEAGAAADLELCLATIEHFTAVPHCVLLERSIASAAINRNRALRRSRAPFVCFLDDDAWVTPSWIETMLGILHQRPEFAMIGPKLKLETGRVFCFGLQGVTGSGIKPVGFGSVDDARFAIDWEPLAIPTTCLVVKREAALAAGGFDERYESSQWEDLDYYMRLRFAGYRGMVTGRATVYHRNLFRTSHFDANLDRFTRRWGEWIAPPVPTGNGCR